MFGRGSGSGPASPAHPGNLSPSSSVAASPQMSPASSGAAGAVGYNDNAPRRLYKDLFTHQYAHVSAQTDEGLRSVKRCAAYFERVSEQQIASSDTTLKAIKAVKEKYASVNDECTHYVHASMMVEEVLLHTEKAKEAFSKSLLVDLVKPMRLWYTANSNKRAAIDKAVAKLSDNLKSQIDSIDRERKSCLAEFQQLKAEFTKKQQLEASNGTAHESYPKTVAKWKKLKESTVKKFQTFESHLDAARTIQANFIQKEIPVKLSELEQLERDRLAYIQECFLKFQQLFDIFTKQVQSSNDLIGKVLPTLNINKAMNLLFDKWTASYGPPPALMPVPYDLPCLWSDVQSDVLDSNQKPGQSPHAGTPIGGHAGVAPANGYAPSGSSYAAPPPPHDGGFHPPPHHGAASPASSYSSYDAPPPPPPAQNHHDHNPFAAEAHPAAAAAAEPPLFYAEAVFDFDLQSEAGGDIQYVNFKTGDRISVYQEGDEWWYGEVGGNSGFFPCNYVKRL